jgi:hypothetical protein
MVGGRRVDRKGKRAGFLVLFMLGGKKKKRRLDVCLECAAFLLKRPESNARSRKVKSHKLFCPQFFYSLLLPHHCDMQGKGYQSNLVS